MIDIITLHDICNPGSIFQAYALNKYILDLGYDCQIIDYVPSYSHIGKNKIKGILKNILFGKNYKIIKNKYRIFMQQNMKLTEHRYRTYQELKYKLPVVDLYVVGSDQLWNRDYDCGNDDSYYLKFVNNVPKMSYATSLGKKNISETDLKYISERITDFTTISVREKSSSSLLSSKLKKDVQWVCDPVFLLEKDCYTKNLKRKIKDKYIVVYLSAATELLEQLLKTIQEERKYKIVLLGGNITRCTCDFHVKDMGPEDFLSYLYYAEAVLSSSFHATAFSHIFHKKFGVILPEKNGERIESLLSLSDLENHIITKKEEYENILLEIDYQGVDKKIEAFVEESKNYLTCSIVKMLTDKERNVKKY